MPSFQGVPRAGGDEPMPKLRVNDRSPSNVFPARAGMNRIGDETASLAYRGLEVFPARAGMNRSTRSNRETQADNVFPARAGMNRQPSAPSASALVSVPRAGGDEPVLTWVYTLRYRCSPRGRG